MRATRAHTPREDSRRKLLLACLTNYPAPVDRRVTRLHELATVNLQRTLQINISDLDPCQRGATEETQPCLCV